VLIQLKTLHGNTQWTEKPGQRQPGNRPKTIRMTKMKGYNTK